MGTDNKDTRIDNLVIRDLETTGEVTGGWGEDDYGGGYGDSYGGGYESYGGGGGGYDSYGGGGGGYGDFSYGDDAVFSW